MTKLQHNVPIQAILFFAVGLLLSMLSLHEALQWSVIFVGVLLVTIKVGISLQGGRKKEKLKNERIIQSNWMKNIGALLLAFLILPQGGHIGLLNSMVNLLFAGAVLWLFTATHRNTTWSIQLFVAVTLLVSVSLIYQQSVQYALLVIVALTFCLLGLFQTQQSFFKSNLENNNFISEKATSSHNYQLLPPKFGLMLVACLIGSGVIFILMPALSPFWKLPEQKIAASGLSDTMTPGDVASVAKSNRLAFRAEFDNRFTPSHSDLYWRVLTLESFDGKTWQQHEDRKFTRRYRPETADLAAPSNAPNVSIIAEPNQRNWLYSFGTSVSRDKDIATTTDTRLIYKSKVTQRIKYQTEIINRNNTLPLSRRDVRRNLQLPISGLINTKQLADTLWQQASQDKTRYSQLIFAHFATQGFSYSLTPATLSGDHIDDFLFNKKEGFCAHFASAQAVLLRLKGIPARVVTGYQGGEFNPNGSYFNVYDSSAHAWVEFSVDNKTWQKIDPTAAVSPDRISDGLEAALGTNNTQNADAMQLVKQTPWLNLVRQHLQSIDYYWTVWVLDFDQTKRENLISNMLQSFSWQFGLVTLLAVIMVLTIIFWFENRKRQSELSPELKVLLRLYNKLIRISQNTAGFSQSAKTVNLAQTSRAHHNSGIEQVSFPKPINVQFLKRYTLQQHGDILLNHFPLYEKVVRHIINSLSNSLYKANTSTNFKQLKTKIAYIK